MPATKEPQAIERRDALVGRMFESVLGTMGLLNVYLGDRLGMYRALADLGSCNSSELSAQTGVAERYAHEWLEQQAVSGFIETDGAADAHARRFWLPAGHDEVLLDQNSLNYLAFAGRFAACLGQVTPKLVRAFQTGGGVSWGEFAEDARIAQAEQNRPIFMNLLAKEWLPQIADVHERLMANPPARVADIGCGVGWSSIAVALQYPNALVDGYDLDEPSVTAANDNAAEYEVGDRAHFHQRDVSDRSLVGQYNLVMGFEMLHDLSHPVETLRVMKGLLAPGGAVIIMDERADAFSAPGDELERLYYGFSTLCCLPAGMSEQPSAATGTVMRADTLRRYAAEAGFSSVEVLPIEHDLFRLYRLYP
jgi:2-polyprenyl-3-methyl-5-hydroxy-6-metoxy-1,4-benzoquinol methylase